MLVNLLASPAVIAAQEAVAPAAAPGVDAASLLRLVVGLALVLGMIVGLAWLLRRAGGIGHSVGGQLRVLGALSVGQRERVVLVQVGETQLLLGVAPGRVQTLHVLDQPLEGLEPPAGAARRQDGPFAARLRELMQQQGQKKR